MQTVLKFRRYMLNLSALLLGVMDLVMSLATILLIGVYQGVREQINQRNHPYLVATQWKSKKPNSYGQFNEFVNSSVSSPSDTASLFPLLPFYSQPSLH